MIAGSRRRVRRALRPDDADAAAGTRRGGAVARGDPDRAVVGQGPADDHRPGLRAARAWRSAVAEHRARRLARHRAREQRHCDDVVPSGELRHADDRQPSPARSSSTRSGRRREARRVEPMMRVRDCDVQHNRRVVQDIGRGGRQPRHRWGDRSRLPRTPTRSPPSKRHRRRKRSTTGRVQLVLVAVGGQGPAVRGTLIVLMDDPDCDG